MIAIDQPNNQNIAVIKAYRVTIGLTEDKFKAFFLSLSSNTSSPIRRTSEGVSLVGQMSLYSAKRIKLKDKNRIWRFSGVLAPVG